ncbi:MAG: PDZ domain-containing protein [Pseudomonadota bacterium]
MSAASVAVLGFAGFHAGSLAAKVAYAPSAAPEVAREAAPDFAAVGDTGNDAPRNVVAPVFGVPDAAAPVAAPATRNATYVLEGVTVTGLGRWAMLSVDGISQLVREGDALGEGELVKAINTTQVVIEAGGALTVVSFDADETPEEDSALQASLRADLSGVEAAPDQPRVTVITPPDTQAASAEPVQTERPAIDVKSLRRAFFAPDALSKLRFVRARSTDGGIGLQLKWFEENPITKAAGLERGDVLVSVNDVPITDSTGLQGLAAGLSKLDRIVLKYERKQQPIEVVIPIVRS